METSSVVKATHANCAACLRGVSHPFATLGESELKRINLQKNVHQFDRGEVVYHEGTPALAAYCIMSGSLQLYHEHMPNRLSGGLLVGPRSLIGLSGILGGRPYDFSAKSVDRSELCIIPASTILALVSESHDFAKAMLKAVTDSFFFIFERLETVARSSVKQRLAHVLVDALTQRKGESPASGKLKVSLLRSELAELAGTTPETCSRTLGMLEDSKIVELTRTAVLVKNLKALRRVASAEPPRAGKTLR